MFEEPGEQDEGLTGEGVLLGTPDYMAPEQARDPRTADVRSDIYSLGCVLYHALAGHPPFPDTNIISQMIRHATEPPKPLKEFNPAVPDGLQPIVNWMLAKDPAGRYPTPERAAQALQMYLAATAEPLHAPESDPQMKTYLTWLEVEGEKAPASAAASAALAAAPTLHSVAMPPAAHPTPAPARPAAPAPPKPPQPPGDADKQKHAAAKRRNKKKHRSKHSLPPVPAAVVAAVAAPPINVELVPLPPPPKPPPMVGPPFSRRDFVTFGIGVGAGALVTFLGCLVALLGRH